ncbi:MAG: hypothetical protein OXJ64_20160 [Boseongicola sp.]|nr:hypothetical protein [Boseongicola sp.]
MSVARTHRQAVCRVPHQTRESWDRIDGTLDAQRPFCNAAR